jgi:hypothetical protein
MKNQKAATKKITVKFELSEEEAEAFEACIEKSRYDRDTLIKRLVLTMIAKVKIANEDRTDRHGVPRGQPYDPAIFA